jgi:hypothetical protein
MQLFIYLQKISATKDTLNALGIGIPSILVAFISAISHLFVQLTAG